MSKMSELHLTVQESLNRELKDAGYTLGYTDIGWCILETSDQLKLEPEQVFAVLEDLLRGGLARAKHIMESGEGQAWQERFVELMSRPGHGPKTPHPDNRKEQEDE